MKIDRGSIVYYCYVCQKGVSVPYCWHDSKVLCSRACWEIHLKSDEFKNFYRKNPD